MYFNGFETSEVFCRHFHNNLFLTLKDLRLDLNDDPRLETYLRFDTNTCVRLCQNHQNKSHRQTGWCLTIKYAKPTRLRRERRMEGEEGRVGAERDTDKTP